jgi:hypothetical protein
MYNDKKSYIEALYCKHHSDHLCIVATGCLERERGGETREKAEMGVGEDRKNLFCFGQEIIRHCLFALVRKSFFVVSGHSASSAALHKTFSFSH